MDALAPGKEFLKCNLVESMDDQERTNAELKAEIADLHNLNDNRCNGCSLDKQAIDLAVEKLRQSELKYRTIFENVQDVFYQTDLNGIIHEISPSVKYFSEFIAEELIGKPVFEIYADPEERYLLLARLSEQGEVRDYEIRLKTKGGETKFASINARLIFDEEDKPTHINGSLRDITARKVAEEAIVEREKELNYAQQLAKMGSWKLDLLTNVGVWSKNMFALLGYPDEEREITFEAFLDMVHPEDRPLIDRKMQKLISTRAGVSFEFRHFMQNGDVRWFQNTIEPHLMDGQLISLTGVNMDITESKLLEMELIKAKEQAEASDRLKTAFMNNISHEIRTPLNAIQGFAPLIIDPNVDLEEKQEMVELLNFSVHRLIQTITDYMDISLITSGNIELSRKEFSLEQVVQELLHHFQERCNEKSLLLNLEVQDSVYTHRITTDKGILMKILSHLLYNAIKFTLSGEITIGISRKELTYEFFVRDTGKGISPENMTSIFKHFVQEDESSSRPFEGSGLGLYIVKNLVSLLGGNILVESVRGKGSTFSFALPVG